MSEFFTASNGILLGKRGQIVAASKASITELHGARKEFYQHLRDQELGGDGE